MYQSSNFRRTQPSQDAPTDSYRSQAQQLQEAFPSWSNEDLQSLLVEVSGDIQVAATRITEGHAEQWGSVTRKKDKKPLSTSQSQSKDGAAPRERGDFRGGRGGRGARGGPGRGGSRGSFSRGGHHETNGHRPKPSQGADGVAWKDVEEFPTSDAATTAVPVNGAAKSSEDATQDWGAPAGEATWGDTVQLDVTSPAAAWGSSTPPTWGSDAVVNGSASAAPTHTPVPAKVVKTPATSKMSWAQIARPQEKPVPSPPAHPAPPAVPASVPAPSGPSPVPSPPPDEESAQSQQGWEEPTTVQPPPWDDEPPAQPADSWSTAPELPAVEEPKPVETDVETPEEPSLVPDRIPPASPPQASIEPESVAASVKPPTPAAHTRPIAAPHRSSAKFKTTDQAVVMPNSNFGTAVEKVGMQFGSLSLSGDELDANSYESTAPEPATPTRPVETITPDVLPPSLPAQTSPLPAQTRESPAPSIVSPPAQTPLSAVPSLFQQAIPQQAHQQQSPVQSVSQSQHSLPVPSSLTQSAIPSQVSLQPSSSTSSISPYSTQSQALPQQTISNHQLPQNQLSIQSQHHQYVQHGLPTHLDPTQSQVQHSPSIPQASQQQQQQQQNISGPPYFRQPESPYFNAPTPPVAQTQDSPYGAFGQLSQQVQHQGQGSHLGSFGGEYGYGETQRNFYDSYTGPGSFGNRNVLSHDEIKGLPGAQQQQQQQQHAAPSLPSNTQPAQQLPPSQTGNQTQPSAGQGPQQNYPPPLPYYYPYPQNQYYGSPYNSGYTLPQPFVKYPAVFQGPPGPQSAPSPAAKQGPSAVQPQSPYGQSLYGQQHPSNTYDDIGYQHHTQHSHGQSVGSGLPSSDYGKHQSLYGASGQGMQGFMGLGQSTGPSSGPPLGQRAGGGSPETVYKPYGGNVGVKDVGSGVGVGVGQGGVGQGPQTRGGVQQPVQGSFYAAQRFAASTASVPQSQQAQQHQQQGQGPQGHLGYPQGGSDGSTFYSYQPRQQQGYWQ